MKKYQVLISRRYLRSRVVNLIAVVAVMLGVAALIIVMAVMDGFAHDIQERIRGIMSHVVVESPQLVGIGDYERVMRRIEEVPAVVACSPLVESPFVLIRSGDRTRAGHVRGIDIEREVKTSRLRQYVQTLHDEVGEQDRPEGRGDSEQKRQQRATSRMVAALARPEPAFTHTDGREPEHPGALVGVELAARMGAHYPGATLSVTSPTTVLTFQDKAFDAVGAFRCGHYEYDDRLIYVPLEEAQELLGLPGRVTSISVRLRDVAEANGAKDAIREAIRNPTPLLSPERAEGLNVTSGTCTVREEGGARWLRVEPETPGGAAEMTIPDVAAVLRTADEPSAIALAVRRGNADPGAEAPWFRLSLIDSAGRRYTAGADVWRAYVPATTDGAAIPAAYELANFVSADGLDLLDPADIRALTLEVHNAPIELTGLRFQDIRPITVSTWRDKQVHLLRAVEVERYIQVIIMTLMVVIAGFSIMAILWLMVKEKTRDIGILMSLGATRGGIIRIFLLNGLMIGVTGAALGLAAGWTVSANLNTIEDWIDRALGWRVFPPDIYYLDRLPHIESPLLFIAMALVAVAVSLVASLWPAFRASRLDPVEALRYE